MSARSRISKNHFCTTICILAASAVVSACGGGGGGGGDIQRTAPPTPPSYTGVTTAAVISSTNASALAANIVGGNAATMIGGLTAVSTSADPAPQAAGGVLQLSRELGKTFSGLPARIPRPGAGLAAVVPIDSTVPCDSGSMRMMGTLSDSGLGTVSVTFSNCQMGADIANGTVSMRIDAFDMMSGVPTDFTMMLDFLAFTSATSNVVMAGSLRLQTNLAANAETLTANFVTRDNITARTTKAENLVFVTAYNNIQSPSSYTETASGRMYEHVNGYVDIATPTPLAFGTMTQEFADSGQMLLTGASSARVRITARSSTLVSIGVDLNGDGAYEISAVMRWTDLSGPVGADLADNDGDGMHNSWETANGLNPASASDALLDKDGDGFSNLREYAAGSNAADPASVPPPVQVVPLAGVSDLVYDPATTTIYAAVRGNPGRIVPINPSTGAPGAAIAVGIDPVKLARADNGQYLYVALDGESAVQRINLASMTADLKIALGSGSFGPLFADDLQVLPGNADAFAVSLKYKGVSPRHAGVAIYDGTVRRANVTPGHTGSNVLEFSASSGTLYGYNNETTEYGFRRMAVDAAGVTVLDVFTSFDGDLISGPADIRFDGGLIYTTTGRVVDPVARTVLRTFAVPTMNGNLVAADAALGEAFFVVVDPSSGTTVRAFDTTTAALIGTQTIAGATGAWSGLIRWGTDGLAFRSGDNVYLIESSTVIPQARIQH